MESFIKVLNMLPHKTGTKMMIVIADGDTFLIKHYNIAIPTKIIHGVDDFSSMGPSSLRNGLQELFIWPKENVFR